MNRATIYKMLLMLGLTAGTTMLPAPVGASADILNFACSTQCIGASGVTHACTVTVLGIPIQLNVGINQPVQACGPLGTQFFDPLTQQACRLTPDALAGIAIPIQDHCGSYSVVIETIVVPFVPLPQEPMTYVVDVGP
jgi:hypothetical protein